MKKFFLLVVMIGLVAAVWYGARWFRHKDDLRATIVMKSAGGALAGAPVVENGARIGEVTAVAALDGRDAVSVRIDATSRNRLMNDSLVSIEDDPLRLELINTIAIGRPVSDGAVIEAREDRLTRWLATRGAELTPMLREWSARADRWVRDVDVEEFEKSMDSLEEKLPEWRRSGAESFERNAAKVREKGRELEERLRELGRGAEADRVRKRIEELKN